MIVFAVFNQYSRLSFVFRLKRFFFVGGKVLTPFSDRFRFFVTTSFELFGSIGLLSANRLASKHMDHYCVLMVYCFCSTWAVVACVAGVWSERNLNNSHTYKNTRKLVGLKRRRRRRRQRRRRERGRRDTGADAFSVSGFAAKRSSDRASERIFVTTVRMSQY